MSETNCENCIWKSKYPNLKCCFNCARAGMGCDVWHTCKSDCPAWEPKEENQPTKKPHYAWWGYIKSIIQKYPARRAAVLHGTAQREQEAVHAAIDVTEQLPNGELRIKVIRLVLWDRTHTLEGAASAIPCSRSWAAKWQRDFFEAVARNRDLLD